MKNYSRIVLTATFFAVAGLLFATEIAAQPTSQPDRIILSWSDNSATTQSVTWRTSTEINESFAEIAEAADKTPFPKYKKSYTAKKELVESTGMTYHSHSVTFTDLKPDTMYCYRVGQGRTWSEWFTFTTGSQDAQPFSFLYFGDAQSGLDTVYPRLVRKAFLTSPEAKFAIFVGDLVNTHNNEKQWDDWFKAIGFLAAMYPIMPVAGNHEYSKVIGDDGVERREITHIWQPSFTLPENGPETMEELSFSFVYNGVQFIGLDSTGFRNRGEAWAEGLAWLDNVLKNSTSRWTIVYFHFPIYSPAKGRDLPGWRAAIKPILDKYKVDLVLAGHDHVYTRTGQHTPKVDVVDLENATEFDPDSRTVYVTSMAGDKMYELQNRPYFVKTLTHTQLFQTIKIDGNVLTLTTQTATGQVIDSVIIEKNQ